MVRQLSLGINVTGILVIDTVVFESVAVNYRRPLVTVLRVYYILVPV